MMNPPEDERDPQLEELLAGYREFLDQGDSAEEMPDDITARIRQAIAREEPPTKSPRPRNRSMFALAASVALIGAGLGATVLVTSQGGGGSEQVPIRAGAVDEQASEALNRLPDQDFTVELPGQPGVEASVVVPVDTSAQSAFPVVFVLDGKTSPAAMSLSSTCAEESSCVAVLIPAFGSISDPAERASAQLSAVEETKSELADYAGLNDSWLVYGDVDPSDPVIVAGLQRGLFQPLDDLQDLE